MSAAMLGALIGACFAGALVWAVCTLRRLESGR